MNKKIHIFGGGLAHNIANHLSLAALAYGTTAKQLSGICSGKFDSMDVELHLSKMAGGNLTTVQSAIDVVDRIVEDPQTKIVFFTCAFPDYYPVKTSTWMNPDLPIPEEPEQRRFDSRSEQCLDISCGVGEKVINRIRKKRKDIFLIGFKTTVGKTEQEMFEAGLRQCKESSVNLCFVNDTGTRKQMIITPEEAAYANTCSRGEALVELVDIVWHRSHLTFTQSTVIDGKPIPWDSPQVPQALRTVVDFCITQGAYKPFMGATVGHFACKIGPNEFLTSIRRSNFNDLDKTGLVQIITNGPDTVLAFGAKPSVGGQSQRMIFRDHEGCNCVVHFHCPLKENPKDEIPTVSQREYECGSHQCGQRTSDNLKEFPDYGGLKAVYLDKHGPNIVFDDKKVTAEQVIQFIENNFDLNQKTGGYTLPTPK